MIKSEIAIGADVGGTNIQFCALNISSDDFFSLGSVPYPKGASSSAVAEYIVKNASVLAEKRFSKSAAISGIGVAVPGSIDSKRGYINFAHNLPLYDAPLLFDINSVCDKYKTALINDADAATVAENEFGALKNVDNCCLITLGTGVGAGIIINGELFLGGNGRGTELGHMSLDVHGNRYCSCKNVGCFEALCNAGFLSDRAKQVFDKELSAKQVIDLAKENNTPAVQIFNEYIDNLSSALASVMNILDPKVIAIGGGISLAGDFLLDPLKKQVNNKCFFSTPSELRLAVFTDNAGALGAAIIVKRQITEVN